MGARVAADTPQLQIFPLPSPFSKLTNPGTPGSSDEVVDANYGVHRGSVAPASNFDVDKTEAPVTVKAYLACAFAAFGGIFFGYDSGEHGGRVTFFAPD